MPCPVQKSALSPGMTKCPNTRPILCNGVEKVEVCGVLTSRIRKNFDSWCSACRISTVSAYINGECPTTLDSSTFNNNALLSFTTTNKLFSNQFSPIPKFNMPSFFSKFRHSYWETSQTLFWLGLTWLFSIFSNHFFLRNRSDTLIGFLFLLVIQFISSISSFLKSWISNLIDSVRSQSLMVACIY